MGRFYSGKIPENPDIIVDANISREYVDILKKNGANPLYIIDLAPNMSDKKIMDLGNRYGGIPIATKNSRHFKQYSPRIDVIKENAWDALEYLGYA